jgi:hypothetical protein
LVNVDIKILGIVPGELHVIVAIFDQIKISKLLLHFLGHFGVEAVRAFLHGFCYLLDVQLRVLQGR